MAFFSINIYVLFFLIVILTPSLSSITKEQQLNQEEEKLSEIAKQIDENSDGGVNEDELSNWIRMTQRKYIVDDVERQWKAVKLDDQENEAKETVSWAEYIKKTYGDEESSESQPGDGDAFSQMKHRDKRRWNIADLDHDQVLNMQEFTAFLHPEDDPRMSDVVVDETMEDLDKDEDGRISMLEYIRDMYSPAGLEADGNADGNKNSPPDEDSLPDWVRHEKESFKVHRDLNGDGYLDRGEVASWVTPHGYDHASAEAKHLIASCDDNNDGQLSLAEIISHYNEFVSSAATDFGELLTMTTASHDEL